MLKHIQARCSAWSADQLLLRGPRPMAHHAAGARLQTRVCSRVAGTLDDTTQPLTFTCSPSQLAPATSRASSSHALPSQLAPRGIHEVKQRKTSSAPLRETPRETLPNPNNPGKTQRNLHENPDDPKRSYPISIPSLNHPYPTSIPPRSFPQESNPSSSHHLPLNSPSDLITQPAADTALMKH